MRFHSFKFSVFKAVAAALAVSSTGYFLWTAFRESRDIQREVVLSVDWKDIVLACSREGADIRSVMESLSTIGVSAIVARDQTLDEFEARGQVIQFSRQESSKLKGLGLVEESAPVDYKTVWVKDPQTAADLMDTASENGLEFSSRSLQGFSILAFGRDFRSMSFPVGPDPQAVSEAEYASMAVVLDGARCSGFSKSARRLLSDPSVLAAGLWLDSEQRCHEAAGEAVRLDRWVVSPAGAVGPRQMRSRNIPVLPAGRAAYRTRYVPASAVDAVREDSVRFLRVKFNPEKKIDENIGALREIAKNIRDNGYETAFPAFSQAAPFRGFGIPGRLLALFLAALAPLFAVKISLDILKTAAKYRCSVPEDSVFFHAASPAWEIASGAGAVLLLTLLCGLFVHALSPSGLPGGHRTGAFVAGSVPVLLALFILYGEILAGLSRWYRSSLTVRDFIIISSAVLFATLLLNPILVIEHSRRLLSFVWMLTDAFPLLRRHWREILLAYPALVMSFWLYLSRFVPGREPGARYDGRIFGGDFRPFMILGLLAPVLACSNFSRPGSAFFVTAWLTVSSAFWGCLLGGGLVAATSTFLHVFGDYQPVPESRK